MIDQREQMTFSRSLASQYYQLMLMDMSQTLPDKQLCRDGNISFRYMRACFSPAVLAVVSHALNNDNLFSIGLRSLSPEMDQQITRGNQAFVASVLEESCRNSLSIVAIDAPSGEVAGAFLIKDFLAESSELEPSSYLEKVITAIDARIMSETSHPIKAALKEKGQVADMLAFGVSQKYAGKKVGNRLMELAIKNCKEKGFKFVYALVTDARSRHLFAKYGCESLGKLKDYSEFVLDGEKPLRNVEENCPLQILSMQFY